MECFSVEGNRFWLDGGAMFGNAPKSLWNRLVDCDEQNRIQLASRCLVVNTENLTLLFETGIGFFMEPKLAERYSIENNGHVLLKNLEKIGIKEQDIDYVIISHLHFDHCGGLLPVWAETKTPTATLHFPCAQYVISKTQYERSLSPHPRDRASFIDGLGEKLTASGRLILVDDDTAEIDALAGIVSFWFSHGHTPGLMHSIIRGAQETIFFASDLIPGTPWLHLPLAMGYDRFPEGTINEKRIILERAVSENWLLFYTHDPFIAASRVKLSPKGRYEAYAAIEQLNDLKC